MVTNPTDIASYAQGAAFTNAAYSGGAGGTFTDLVSGLEEWTVASATPTIETRGGIDGVSLPGADATHIITHPFYSQGECTVVMIMDTDTNVTSYPYGTDSSGNYFGVQMNTRQVQAYAPSKSSGRPSSALANVPFVIACSWGSDNFTAYASVYDGTQRDMSTAYDPRTTAHFDISYPTCAIGKQGSNIAFDGWVGEIHIFHESLHLRESTALADLLLTLGDKVGL